MKSIKYLAEIVSTSGYCLLGLLLLCITIIVLPLILVVAAYLIVAEKLNDRKFKNIYISDKKYILIAYENNSPWEKVVHENLLPIYNKHVVVKGVSDGDFGVKGLSVTMKMIANHLYVDQGCSCDEEDPEYEKDQYIQSTFGILLIEPEGIKVLQRVGPYDASKQLLAESEIIEQINDTIKLWQINDKL